MNAHKKPSLFENLKKDLPASIVVFLVALPLCLGIALASGAPLFSGIIAGIVGGVVVSVFSGSQLGVSGPAAGLTVIVLSSIQELGAFETFLLAVFISGLIQIVFGILKAGVIGYYFPSAVIKGMLSAIGIIIVLKQIPHAFGYDKDPEGDYAFFQADGHNTLSELLYAWDFISPGALIITAVSMFILILWERPFMKRIGLFSWIQGPLVAVASGIGLNVFFRDMGEFALNPDQVVNIPVSDSLVSFLGQFTLPDFSQLYNPDVYVIALTIAIVGSLETLLSVEATDRLDEHKRITPTNRELFAQGIGNSISGLIGGLPLTQVIVRSSANIQSGGQSKASSFIHGMLLLVSAMAIPHVLNLVPLASLAAILLVVGYKLAKPAIFKNMIARGKTQYVPFLVTVLAIVFTDLLYGIALGLMVAFFQILWNNFKTPYHFNPDEYSEDKPVHIDLSEDVSFLNKASIMNMLKLLPNNAHVIVNASKARSIHPDIIEIFDDFRENAKDRDIKFELFGLKERDDSNSEKQLSKAMPKKYELLSKRLRKKKKEAENE